MQRKFEWNHSFIGKRKYCFSIVTSQRCAVLEIRILFVSNIAKHYYLAGIYMLKVAAETLVKGTKYVLS